MGCTSKVWAGGLAVASHIGNVLTGGHAGAWLQTGGEGVPHVAVDGGAASCWSRVVDHDPLAKTLCCSDVLDGSGLRCVDGRAVVGGEILPPVHLTVARTKRRTGDTFPPSAKCTYSPA